MTTDILVLIERLRATIHRINNHWWNKRVRPAAPDLHLAISLLSSYHSLAQDIGFSDVGEALVKASEMRGALLSLLGQFDQLHSAWAIDRSASAQTAILDARNALATGEPA